MGAVCSCTTGEKVAKSRPPIPTKPSPTVKSVVLDPNASVHSSDELLDDRFRADVKKAIDEYTATLPSAYQAERDRIVHEMSQSASGSYLGLAYSDYPGVNGEQVNRMARQLVSSKDAKEQLLNRIDHGVDAVFLARTSNWSASSRDAARPVVRAFIEKQINDAFDQTALE